MDHESSIKYLREKYQVEQLNCRLDDTSIYFVTRDNRPSPNFKFDDGWAQVCWLEGYASGMDELKEHLRMET